MAISGKTNLFGLVGTPIKHSFSPLMHNHFFANEDIDAAYLCFDMDSKSFKNIKQSVKTLGVQGFNVTIPYKENIISELDSIDKEAKIIGAVNTVAVNKGKLKGYNTDGIGFIASLKEKAKFDPKGKYAVIIGCGGASRALACYLLKEKVEFLGLCDIDTKRAKKLANDLKKHYKKACIHVYESSADVCLKDVDLLVNATGLGRKKSDPKIIDSKKIHKDILVYDLIYSPAEPELLKIAAKKGCKTMNGLWMLIYQGLKAQEIWQGQEYKGGEKILLAGVKKAGVL